MADNESSGRYGELEPSHTWADFHQDPVDRMNYAQSTLTELVNGIAYSSACKAAGVIVGGEVSLLIGIIARAESWRDIHSAALTLREMAASLESQIEEEC